MHELVVTTAAPAVALPLNASKASTKLVAPRSAQIFVFMGFIPTASAGLRRTRLGTYAAFG
jgi:hypothetical protein